MSLTYQYINPFTQHNKTEYDLIVYDDTDPTTILLRIPKKFDKNAPQLKLDTVATKEVNQVQNRVDNKVRIDNNNDFRDRVRTIANLFSAQILSFDDNQSKANFKPLMQAAIIDLKDAVTLEAQNF